MTGKIPRSLSNIVSKSLERDPNLRYQTATELLRDLDAWQDNGAAATLGFTRCRAVGTYHSLAAADRHRRYARPGDHRFPTARGVVWPEHEDTDRASGLAGNSTFSQCIRDQVSTGLDRAWRKR